MLEGEMSSSDHVKQDFMRINCERRCCTRHIL